MDKAIPIYFHFLVWNGGKKICKILTIFFLKQFSAVFKNWKNWLQQVQHVDSGLLILAGELGSQNYFFPSTKYTSACDIIAEPFSATNFVNKWWSVFLWTYNSKGHYDPLSKFYGGQFAILEGHKKIQLKCAMWVNLWPCVCVRLSACARESERKEIRRTYF